MNQHFLNLNRALNDNLIISKENYQVYELLKILSEKLVMIIGSTKSGKSTLVSKFANLHKAKIIKNQKELEYSKNQNIYFIDSDLSQFNSELLFHFVQNIIVNNDYLYVFSKESNFYSFDNMKDLDSRIALFSKYYIHEPNEELMLLLLKKNLEVKSIKLENVILNEVIKLIERSYISVYNCANDINRLLYQNNHIINLKIIREFYNAL